MDFMNKSATREQPNFNVCNGMAAIVAPSLVLAIFLACAFAEHRGIISLDSITFDKVISTLLTGVFYFSWENQLGPGKFFLA